MDTSTTLPATISLKWELVTSPGPRQTARLPPVGVPVLVRFTADALEAMKLPANALVIAELQFLPGLGATKHWRVLSVERLSRDEIGFRDTTDGIAWAFMSCDSEHGIAMSFDEWVVLRMKDLKANQ